jgi:serine/threonine protein kinase
VVVKMCDLGLAVSMNETPSRGQPGTLWYMAPEVLLGKPECDPRQKCSPASRCTGGRERDRPAPGDLPCARRRSRPATRGCSPRSACHGTDWRFWF